MATYTPRQKNWKWFANDAAEPSTQLANENVKPTLANNTDIIRLRVCIAEIGGKADTSVTVSVEYSTDDINFTAFGAGNHWNYADGAATEGQATTTFKLTDTTTHNEYCESGTNIVSIAASSANELDIAIVPTASVQGSTTYYFRVKGDGNIIALDTGETHPQVLTAAPPQVITLTKMALTQTGKVVKLNFVSHVAKMSLTWSGKLVGLPCHLILDKMAVINTGQSVKFNVTVHVATVALTWIGKNVIIPGEEIIQLLKMSLTYTGKSVTVLIQNLINIPKLTLNWLGKRLPGLGGLKVFCYRVVDMPQQLEILWRQLLTVMHRFKRGG